MAIEKKKSGTVYEDVMQGADRWETKVLDQGLVAMVDVMPRMVPVGKTADFAIVQAARVSYGEGTKEVNEDVGLVRYLYRHRHTTPVEMVEFKFHIVAPIAVVRQWLRHRTANVNEYSARYSVVKDRFYIPSIDNVRTQSKTNKQGSEGVLDEVSAEVFLGTLGRICDVAYHEYEDAIAKGVSREQARLLLPVNVYTEFYWKCDLHNLLHFLALRMDAHAQQEIRDFANAIYEMVKEVCPYATQAFDDYHPMRGGMLITALEIDAIRRSEAAGLTSLKDVDSINSANKREREEWQQKVKRLTSEPNCQNNPIMHPGDNLPPDQGCKIPPTGWYCSRTPGHDGPCAARLIAKSSVA